MKHKSNWREQAISLLQRNTDSVYDIIAHFVDLCWIVEESDEENLDRFETYQEEHAQISSY